MIDADGLARRRVPFEAGFLTGPLSRLEDVRLRGTRCCSCGEVFFGRRVFCETCQADELKEVALGKSGTLYTFTIVRHRPPGDYRGPEPFVPFAAAIVELPDGLRIVTRLSDCDFDRLEVGMPVELVVAPYYRNEQGDDVIAYSFRPAG